MDPEAGGPGVCAKRNSPDASLWAGIKDVAREASPSWICMSRRPDLSALEEVASGLCDKASGQDTFWSRELLQRIKQMSAWQATGLDAELKTKLRTIADECDTLVNDMEFGFLFHRRKKVMSVGYDVDTQRLEPSSYDLLASESRIASFVAVAKGDVPQEAWFHLGRRHTLASGQKILVSWTGTMFEYLMPTLWMTHYRNTIMQDSMER